MSAGPVVLDVESSPDECAEWAASAPLGEGVLLPFGVIDPEALSQNGRVDLLVALERVKGWVEAQQARVLASAEAHAVPPPQAKSAAAQFRAKQYVREEIACALRWSVTVTGDRLCTARTLVDLLPATLAALEVGELPFLHARSVADAVHDLGRAADGTPHPGLVAKFEAHVLDRAEHRTVSEFRTVVTRALHRFDPRTQAAKHRAAAADRKVTCSPDQNGMAFLGALLPAADAQTVLSAIQAVADRARHDATRTADQKRADALVELCQAALDGQAVGDLPRRQGRRAAVQVSVALSTLLGLDEQPGELAGYGPVPAEVARAIAYDPTSTWRRLLTDPRGRLVDYGRTTYRPPADLRDHVIAAEPTCSRPGCNRTAPTCDLDHLIDWDDGGQTNADNLGPKCPRDHNLKHDAGWQHQRLPDGTNHWTTPLHRTYDKPPHEYPIDHTRPAPVAPDPNDEPPPF